MASRIRHNIYAKTLYELVEQFNSGELSIPEHQREYCWNEEKQVLFIRSIKVGLPTTGILIRKERGENGSLEDGRQRLTTVSRYFRGEFKVDGALFLDLPVAEQRQIQNYNIGITEYSNATEAQAIEIFDRAQNGLPLTIGQRMHALTARSPVIRFAKRTLLTAGTGLHDRAIPSWGARNGKDDKRKTLENAVVLCCSAAFGETTRKWNEILTKELLTIPFNETEAVDVLMKLLTVYESVSAVPAGAVVRNKQWSLSNFSPYIVWSIREFPGEFPRLLQGWKQFLAEVRGDPKKMEVLKADVGAARGWSTERWKRGYRRVFDPAGAAAEYGQIHGEDYDDESDDEY